MIKIKEMEIEGYASLKHIVFNWDQEGLNVIQAPNGSGKSKLISSLIWILYGKPLSGSVTPWESLQVDGYKGTKGTIKVRSGKTLYQIIRCKDYKGEVLGAKGKDRLIITQKVGDNFEEVPIDKKKGDKQKYIDSLMGYSFELFKNSIIFGQKLKKLISESGPNKKKVLDEAFEVLWITNAKKAAEERLTKVKLEIYKVDPLIDSLQVRIMSEEKLLKSLKVEKAERAKNTKVLIDQLNLEIKDLKKTLKDYQSKADLIPNHNDRVSKLHKKIESINQQKRGKEKSLRKESIKLESDKTFNNRSITELRDSLLELEKSLSVLPKYCPRCKKPFSKSERDEEGKTIESEIKGKELSILDLEADIKEIVLGITANKKGYSSLSKFTEEVELLSKEKNALENKISNYLEFKDQIPIIKKKIFDKETQIHDINKDSDENNIPKLEKSIADLKNELKPIEINFIKLKRQKKLLQWAINEPLSNSGFKVYIFDTMLDKVNDRLEYYSDFVGFKIIFAVDLIGKNKDINTYIIKNEEVCPYEDLSGGQQQSVDIATIFAIHDVVTENKSCNLLLMDEVFESLDSSNIELVTELIQEKSKDKCLYLVTHRSEFIPTHSNIIHIDYKNGISSIAQ